MKKTLSLVFLAISVMVFGQKPTYDSIKPLANYNFVLGTNGIGGKYKFSEESKLVEQSKHIRGMGSNILKISLGKNAPQSYGLQYKSATTTLELFTSVPDFKKVFDMDFKYIFAWVHTLTDVKWRQRINKKEEKILYEEMYNFAAYLLKTYSNSGKTFMIGNWEGDWLLHGGFNRKLTPKKEHVENMVKWFNIRQKAIDDAKKQVQHTNVSLYHYIELNLVLKGMNGGVSIVKDVLPNTNVDFVSYSSYEAIKNRSREEMKTTLKSVFTFVEKRLKPKDNLPFHRRIFIGEYGYHANKNKPESFVKQYKLSKEIMEISLELNIPFALHWQMYNNEYDKKTGRSKEMSLINEAGKKTKLYYLHQQYYQKVNIYLEAYKKQHKTYPSNEEFNKKALNILQNINVL
ncbi:MAG: hypothetical protein HWD82_06500 [Flavobacteriaceae bacterium]|nr:hypothetical protein [Flavobacteriaceae bacterium]